MSITPDFIIQVLLALGSGIGVYAGVKSDLARLHERTETHTRQIDALFERVGK